MTITQVVVSPNIVIRDLGSQLGYEVFVHRQARKFHDLFTNLGVRRVPEIMISDSLGTTIKLKLQEQRSGRQTAVVYGPHAIGATIYEETVDYVGRCLLTLVKTGNPETDHIDIDCLLDGWSSGLYITLNFEEHAYRG